MENKTLVSCQQCNAKYAIPTENIPELGRKIKCKKCSNAMLAMKPDDYYVKKFSKGLAKYLLYKKNNKTISDVQYDTKRILVFEKFLKNSEKTLLQVNIKDSLDFKEFINSKLSKEQVEGLVTTITEFFEIMLKEGLITRNPFLEDSHIDENLLENLETSEDQSDSSEVEISEITFDEALVSMREDFENGGLERLNKNACYIEFKKNVPIDKNIRKNISIQTKDIGEKGRGFFNSVLSKKPGGIEKLTVKELYFSFEGRITRKTFNLLGILPYSAIYTLALLLDMVLGTFNEATGVGLITALCVILSGYPILAMYAKRCHDRNKSALFLFLLLVPILNFAIFIGVMFFRGTKGTNRFGNDPLSNI